MELEATYSPLDANHPAPTKDFPILPYRPKCIRWVLVAYSKAVLNLCVRVRFSRITQRLEEFGGDTEFIGRVAENNDVDWLLIESSSGRCFCVSFVELRAV